MRPLLLLDLVGLTPRQIGADTPRLAELAGAGASAPMSAVLPAVTCSAQASMLTGLPPDAHGAVGNGWLDRATMDVALWRQSNRLVEGEKLYEAARRRDPDFSCAKLFWWFNMGAAVDWSITPRPFYPADGRKLLACYSWPRDYGAELERELGAFPFFSFWGPKAGLPATRWIADATILTMKRKRPTLTLAYLPHLDYDHQRYGPEDPRARQALRDLDVIVGELVDAARVLGAEVLAVSEYGIAPVDRPVHPNRALRNAGLLEVRDSPIGELLDPFASSAFALSDHQLAHVYARDAVCAREAAAVLRALPGVERVWVGAERAEVGLDHPRAGDVVCVAEAGSWFTYYYWLADGAAPDFARTVDIHRKPGYDPAELFVDPRLLMPAMHVAGRLLQKALGFRYLMDVVPIHGKLVRGSHGRPPDDPQDGPVFLCSRPFSECGGAPASGVVDMLSVKERALALLFP